MNAKFILLIFILIFLFSTFSTAESRKFSVSYNNLTFNNYADVTIDNNGLLINKIIKVSNNSFTINLDDINISNTNLTLYIKKNNLFYGHIKLNSNNNFIMLNPIAAISGYVIDNKENLIKHALLKFVCSDNTINYPTETDSIGFFSIPLINFGECNIIAIYNGHIGTYNLNINSSKKYIVKLKINNEDSLMKFNSFFAFFIMILIILLLYFILKKKNLKNPFINYNEKLINKNNVKKKDKINKLSINKSSIFNENQERLLKTFSEREKLIIQEIQIKGALTQSQLRFYTGLPKSTLHRTINILENKNILITFEEGGIKRVKLTDFFLES